MGECNHCTWVLVWHFLKLVLAKSFLGVQDCSLGVITLISLISDTYFSSECNLHFLVVILQAQLKLNSSSSLIQHHFIVLCQGKWMQFYVVMNRCFVCMKPIMKPYSFDRGFHTIWTSHILYDYSKTVVYFTKVKCEVY